jgi:hypothetical protein
MINAYQIMFEKRERKRPLEKSKHRLEDSIKIGFKEVWWDRLDWIGLI